MNTCLKEQGANFSYFSAMIVPAKSVEITEIFSPHCALWPNRLWNFTQC
jgi:hypothetical protein